MKINKNKLISLILTTGLILAPINTLAETTKEYNKTYELKENKYLYKSYNHEESNEKVLNGTIVNSLQIASNNYILVYNNEIFGWIEKTNLEETNKTINDNVNKIEELNKEKNIKSFDELNEEEIDNLLNSIQNYKQRDKFKYRIYFPEVNHNVAVYNAFTQGVCDNIDSACSTTRSNGVTIIGDHKNQGFEVIKDFKINETLAYTNDGEKIVEYIVVDKLIGKNNGYVLMDESGTSLYITNPNGITLYTCNENWINITIIYLQPTGKIYNNSNEKSKVK